MEDMTNINKKIDLGLPPWHRNHNDGKAPFAAMASSAIPLLPSSGASHQLCRKPYFMNHDGNMAPVLSEDKNLMTQNPSQPSDHKDMISGGGGGVTVTASYNGLSFDTDDQPVKDVQIRWGRNLDPNMDPKKLKRILSNRVSAQKSRMKKLQYVSDLESHMKALEDKISVLSPTVAMHQNQQQLLKMENNFLKQRITICEDSTILREAQIAEYRAEVNRLKQFMTQHQQQIQGQTTMTGWESGLNQMTNSTFNQSGLNQMANSSVNQFGQEQMINMNSNLQCDGMEQMINMNSNPQCDGMEQMMNFNSLNLNGFI